MKDEDLLKNNSDVDQAKLTVNQVTELIEVFKQASKQKISVEDLACLEKTLVFEEFF